MTETSSYRVPVTNDAPGSAERVAAGPPDSVFHALVGAYEAAGITPNVLLSDARVVGVRDGQFRRVLGRRPLRDFLSCGTSAAGTPLADEYRVTLTALSRVTPAATGGSLVVTQVSATAQSMAQSANPVRCAPTGRLEAAINALAAVRSAR